MRPVSTGPLAFFIPETKGLQLPPTRNCGSVVGQGGEVLPGAGSRDGEKGTEGRYAQVVPVLR